MNLRTSADMNDELSAAIGRFSQICNHLETQLSFIITRLLPLTTNMGRVLLSGNQMRRNSDILAALLILPEVSISEEIRQKLAGLVPRLRSVNDDRSRFLHNPMMGGFPMANGDLPTDLYLVVDKQDGKGSAMFPISIELINERTAEARKILAELYIAPVDYDLTKWESAFNSYAVKPYPISNQPAAPRRTDQKQNDQKKSAKRKTTPKPEA